MGDLAQLDVVPDGIAICMERSFDWISAALRIMRAGAAIGLLFFEAFLGQNSSAVSR